ncbi:hypothetical protein [Shinella zoogloeoides]|uniref:hypothetical protein n=1 Tax=Shinella zoogloeoides TaxID=352475 RepID=UPI000E64C39E|nr:hypothetical protein [Shinella zoogloeoides]
MKSILTALALVIAAIPAQAAVSGFYDSAEQIGTILSSAAVADALRQAPIGHVANTGTRADGAREWQVRTQECDLTVYLKPVPPQGVGKTTYELELGDACQ